MREQRIKQRMISAEDWAHLVAVPDVAKPTAVWLWLNLDPLGRGRADPGAIAAWMSPNRHPLVIDAETVETHLLMMLDAGFLTTYHADGEEWLLLLHPLKCDLRDTRIVTPEPPSHLSHGNPMAVGGAGARERAGVREGARARARARASERVRAEGAARADAWDAVLADRAEPPEEPERPLLLDAPPMFCDEHMPYGAGRKKCGPCRDKRLYRESWLAACIYEQKLADRFEEMGDDDGPF